MWELTFDHANLLRIYNVPFKGLMAFVEHEEGLNVLILFPSEPVRDCAQMRTSQDVR